MAQQKKTTTKKKPAAKTTAKTKTAAPKQAPKQVEPKSTAVDYFHAFSKSRFFKPVVAVLIVLVVIGLDLLISWNKYDRFFKILGIEILITAVILVLKLALTSNKPDTKVNKDNEEYAP
ncbi:MAG: hypothetical protein J6U23_10430 [Clostridiales bacterium]|nr:hypothetical protein [Clostridiales bacterium]